MQGLRRVSIITFLLGISSGAAPLTAKDARIHPVFGKTAPESPEDLLGIQKQVDSVLNQAKQATVCIVGNGSGSGVIVSEDGLVLTAGHVSGDPGNKVQVVMPDGTKLEAESLGRSAAADSGLVRITEKKKHPFVDIAPPATLFRGDWIFAIGHPGGFDKKRGIVLRLGRVIHRSTNTIQSDCKLIGGDSGGPLFDMQGRVVGIHSRVSKKNEQNYHVTVRAFKRDWYRMLAGEVVTIDDSYATIQRKGGFLGVKRIPHSKGVQITGVVKNSPAAQSKLRAGDVISRIDGQKIESLNSFRTLINKHGPGDKVLLDILKRWEGGTKKVEITLGNRNDFLPAKKPTGPGQ
ncbi:MAG: PDZ domain-containing protein [Verrucomicrobiaceae bacterium]|nr:PDZ domain-containing protein [Verrucomicrobiaceae bacterium]